MGRTKKSSLKQSTFLVPVATMFFLAASSSQALAGANVACGDGASIVNTTVFGGSYTPTNICGNNVTITTSGSKNISGGSETNNTNGIYFAMNGPHPAFIFGDSLTVTISGNYVDAIRTNGTTAGDGVFTIATGNNTILKATGSSSDGVNVAQSPNTGSGYGRVYIGQNSAITVANGAAVRVNLSSQSPYYNLAYIGNNAVIKAGGTGSNNMNTVGYAVFAGNRDDVYTNGTASGTNAVAVIGSGADISTTGNNGYAVFANKGGVVQLQGGSVTTSGTGADALRVQKTITAGNNNNALGGRIELAGDVTVSVTDTSGAYALHTLGTGSEISSNKTNYYTSFSSAAAEDKLYDGAGTIVNDAAKITTATPGVYNITGNMFAESGLINLSMTDGSVFTGATKLGSYSYKNASAATVSDDRGTINLKIDGANSKWDMTASSELNNLTLNGSTLNYEAPVGDVTQQASYKTLTAYGNYVGNGGTIILHTYLGNDSSPTDRLVIDGATATATGSTLLAVNNTGGGGAQTTGNGIMLVQTMKGATTTAGAFSLASRVAAGAFDYFLYQGGNAATGGDANDQNWYLRSIDGTPLPPTPPTPFVNPVIDPVVDPVSPPVPAPSTHTVRPEILVASAIQPLALEYGYAMLDTLHERVGETHTMPLAPVTEERVVRCRNAAQNNRCVVRVPVSVANRGTNDESLWAKSGWARLIGNHGENKPDNFDRRGPNYEYTLGGIQAGLDIYGRQQADGTLDKAGIYVGYGQLSADVSGPYGLNGRRVVGKAGTVDIDAYTVGGYWTHFAPSGWYTDAVVQGTWYSADAHSVLNQSIKPDGFGIVASLEGGYAFKFGDGWSVEPQAQVIYQNVSFGNTRDAYGLYGFNDGDSLRGRLGVRVTKTWNMADQGKEQRLATAWLRANIWHEFMGKTTTTVSALNGANAMPFNSYLSGTWGELGAGATMQVSDKVNLFATGAYQHSLDGKGREGWDGRLGMTVKW